MPEFVSQVKGKEPVQKWLEENGGSEKWRVEDSGYLTCIDMTAKATSDADMTQPKQKK